MPLPTTFKLGGRTWTVLLVKELRNKRGKSIHGQCDIDLAIIEIDEDLSGELLEHTFYHEVVHALCKTLGWAKLDDNESKVDALGNMLMQFMATKKGRLAT